MAQPHEHEHEHEHDHERERHDGVPYQLCPGSTGLRTYDLIGTGANPVVFGKVYVAANGQQLDPSWPSGDQVLLAADADMGRVRDLLDRARFAIEQGQPNNAADLIAKAVDVLARTRLGLRTYYDAQPTTGRF